MAKARPKRLIVIDVEHGPVMRTALDAIDFCKDVAKRIEPKDVGLASEIEKRADAIGDMCQHLLYYGGFR